jgi:hypothetical protein
LSFPIDVVHEPVLLLLGAASFLQGRSLFGRPGGVALAVLGRLRAAEDVGSEARSLDRPVLRSILGNRPHRFPPASEQRLLSAKRPF